MNDVDIKNDRETRASQCKGELEAVLRKYEFALLAEDNWTPNTKIRVEISFVDIKKYPTATVAQPENSKVGIVDTGATGPVTEGKQPDGSVVIDPKTLE